MTTDAKRISELQESSNLTEKDYLVINEFDPTIGYTLTKKVTTQKLKEFLYNSIRSLLSADYQLSDLAHHDIDTLLDALMEKSGHGLQMGNNSLALSALPDLNLGNLATLNLEDLHLEQFAEKSYATSQHIAQSGTYINGITQSDGKIVAISTGKFSDAVPVDTVVKATSPNPVQNAAVYSELLRKMNKSDGNMKYNAIQGKYIAGLTQTNGKITDVVTYDIPKPVVDDFLSETSINPAQNNVITKKINQIYDLLKLETANTYVKISDVNSYLIANSKEYVKGIRQKDGRITEIEKGNFSDITSDIEKQLNNLKTYVDQQLDNLKKYIDSTFVKLSTPDNQTITGPVTFNKKIDGSIVHADMSDKSKWS